MVFHSAVLIADHQLLISGGLTPSDMSGSGFGERVCPADVLTIVNLNSSNPTVATLEGKWTISIIHTYVVENATVSGLSYISRMLY